MVQNDKSMEKINDITIRLLNSSDSIKDLTELLHRAYKPLAEAGMLYLASHQDETVTINRISKGECYVAVIQEDKVDGIKERIVGTVVFVPQWVADDSNYYKQAQVAWFQQFAVELEFQQQGIGSLLLDTVEMRARELGAAEIALDTSENASALITYYKKRGYKIAAKENWDITNYHSVIMSKTIK